MTNKHEVPLDTILVPRITRGPSFTTHLKNELVEQKGPRVKLMLKDENINFVSRGTFFSPHIYN